MATRLFQKYVVNKVEADNIEFDRLPEWLFEALLATTPTENDGPVCECCLLKDAAAQWGHLAWRPDFATAWRDGAESLILGTNNVRAATDLALQFDCGRKVLARAVPGVGFVVGLTGPEEAIEAESAEIAYSLV